MDGCQPPRRSWHWYLRGMRGKPKKLSLRIVGLDGNAFSLIAAFRARARIEGWGGGEVRAVLKEATSGDYAHLVSTLARHSRRPCG